MITVEVFNFKTKQVKATLPGATIRKDGRIQFKTLKGDGFLVCKAACEALQIDPMMAANNSVDEDVYYKLDQPMFDTVVRVKTLTKKAKNFKLNPEWERYNDLMNEGGDGYVPSSIPKYIDA